MMYIRIIFSFLTVTDVFGQYYLVLDRVLSPAHSVAANPIDTYYSVPINQTISKPLIGYIVYQNGTRVKHGPLSKEIFFLESLNSQTSINSKFPDKWADSGGRLCQNAVFWMNFPKRMDRSRAVERCGEEGSRTKLKIQAFHGRIIGDWLFHRHTVLPKHNRVFRISHPGLQLYVDTHPFAVTEPAYQIKVIKQPPANVIANHDFSLTAEIQDKTGKRLTTGLDSIGFVELTVPYYYKTFYRVEDKEMILKSSSIRLGGKGVIFHQSTNDLVSRQRAVKGLVTFDNIRVLDAIPDIKLNLTMMMARDPWRRIPNCEICYEDTIDYNLNAAGTEISFRQLLSYKHLPPLTFTDVFRVTEQTLAGLRFSRNTLQHWDQWKDPVTKTISVTRNVVIPGGILLEAVDSNGAIIYSGRDSDFLLRYESKPSNVCITHDATKRVKGGQAYMYFSICQIIANVQIIISPFHLPAVTVTTPPFNVGGKLVLAHFGDFRYSGDGAKVDSHINTFIKLAASNVNKGSQSKELSKLGLKLVVKSYNHENKINNAFSQFSKLISERIKPSDKSHVIISSSRDEITRNLNPELVKIHLPYISVSSTSGTFSSNKYYPYFVRVCWSENEILRSVFRAIRDRLWTKVLLLRDSESLIGETFRSIAAEMKVDVKTEVLVHDFSSEIAYSNQDLLLKTEMNIVKATNLKVIILFANANTQPYIFRAAYLNGIDTDHGYQFILLSKFAWRFPFFNPGVCSLGPKPCTTAFRGTILFSELYNVTGYSSKAWLEVLRSFFSQDKYNMLGGYVNYRSPEIVAKYALGYDAVILFSRALIKIIQKRESITGEAIVKNLRSSNIQGLTGNIVLKGDGDRKGYMGIIAQVWPETEDKYLPLSKLLLPVRLLDNTTKVQYEIPYSSTTDRQKKHNGFYLIKSKKYNRRAYISKSGYYDSLTQTIIPKDDEQWPSVDIIREELMLPPYQCSIDCGNKLLSLNDINKYDTGYCNTDRKCSCYQGFSGSRCTVILCTCRYGKCITPTLCKCHPGWNGSACDIAICSECVQGECVSPDSCQCNTTTWVGPACDIHITIILIPTIFTVILIIIFLVVFLRKLIHKIRKSAALSKDDWIVDWNIVLISASKDVTTTSKSRSMVSLGKNLIETYNWKNEYWYVKFFKNKTMNPKDEELCLEMVQLTSLRHRNLINYGGACLTAPNVSLFLEVATKGSLNDLLLTDSIELGWDFKYNFMKDICLGMKYIHEKKDIGSHGRLKSSNCLVDGRWTIRLSGFGVPTMRFGKYRDESKEEDVQAKRNLLWSAPELMKNATCLDDIEKGTPAGDVYSFAIVVSEIVTRADPYNFELGYLDVSNLLDLILGNNYPELKDARRTWEDIGGADMLIARPILKNEVLPEKPTVRVRFKKMLDDAWHDNPFSRPTFETLITQLNIIHPVTGELIDNLINLLETYSNNLEMIVVERTNELEANKARAEELLSQMLPPNVTNELKLGRKVPPETFDCATVFFSDIVDFQRICQESSPFQIVALLNETYNVFDDVLDEYDVYKVETISDSYMVVSGVPERNGNLHAGEICTMALDLMSTVTHFQIPYRPKATLQLRIGINSGPLVAGVVGVLMPRYCLFGDTVNTASRMMSSSQALCIQVSDKTAEILEELEGYDLESRGERQVKGRGLMTTYWLWGKLGFNRRLPDQSLAISLSQHKFK